MKVLIIDDAKTVRMILKDYLKASCQDIREAGDGCDAMAQLQIFHPDCIFLDWHMPNMCGCQFLKKYRSDPKNSTVKIIVCTTENSLGTIKQALEQGADEYIIKPFDKDLLTLKLQQVGLNVVSSK